MARTMSSAAELGKDWAGKVVENKFPLRQRLGGSDHSAVFLTERAGGQKAAIKLIPAQGVDAEAQLARWAAIAKLSHPHVMRLYESGRCLIDGTKFLYVVMESAEENLGEILPVRALTAAEASDLLPPAAEALGYIHRAGFVHGRVSPSNITAVNNQLKLSSDSLRKVAETGGARAASAYDAPEVATSGVSAAGDVWSVGATLVAVMTQGAPKAKAGNGGMVVPKTIPQPLHEIARQCLQADPQARCTVHDIVRRLRELTADAAEKIVEEQRPRRNPNTWVLAAAVMLAILLGAGIAIKVLTRSSDRPASSAQPAAAPGSEVAATPAASPGTAKSGAGGSGKGSVAQKVMPEVSRNALNTVTGHLKMSVGVNVDAAGKVSQARFVTHGPSQYFANKALAAAQQWKFNPPHVNGQAAPSEWLLRFQFARSGVQVDPTEVKP